MTKRVFTVAQAALHNIVKAVYTNKKDLYDALTKIQGVNRIEFKDVLGYENKKFNYFNVLQLLKVQEVNDSFRLSIYFDDATISTIEIAIKETNKKLILSNGKQ